MTMIFQKMKKIKLKIKQLKELSKSKDLCPEVEVRVNQRLRKQLNKK